MNNQELQNYATAYYKNKTKENKDKLIIESATLVKVIAAKVYAQRPSSDLAKEDYESYGIIGLIDSIDKYDPSMDVLFSTYANKRIYGQIIDEIRRIDPAGRDTRKKLSIYEKNKTEGYSRAEIQKNMKLSNKEMNDLELLVLKFMPIYIDADSDDDKNDAFNIVDNGAPTPEEVFLKEELSQKLQKGLSLLSKKEQRVVQLVYYEEMTLSEIGRLLNVTQSRVSQINKCALKKLKTFLLSEYKETGSVI